MRLRGPQSKALYKLIADGHANSAMAALYLACGPRSRLTLLLCLAALAARLLAHRRVARLVKLLVRGLNVRQIMSASHMLRRPRS